MGEIRKVGRPDGKMFKKAIRAERKGGRRCSFCKWEKDTTFNWKHRKRRKDSHIMLQGGEIISF